MKQINLQIPSEQDWGNYKSDLDQKYAYQEFFGKNLDQAMSRFEQCVIEATDELRFMPSVPFRYYLLAFKNYVTSKQVLKSSMASDAASCFLNLIKKKLQEDPESIKPVMKDLLPAVEYVATNQKTFDADIDIYGDFTKELSEIMRLQQT
jgi:hypothetical protein